MRVFAFILFNCFNILAFSQSSIDFSVSQGIPSAETYKVFQDSRGFLWFCTDNGVARFDGDQMEIFHVKDGLVDPVVFGVSEDYKGRLWFRSYSGKISYFENGKIYPYRYNDVLATISKNQIMTTLYCDSTDRIWFGYGTEIGSIDKNGKLEYTKSPRYTFSFTEVDNNILFGFYGPTHRIDRLIHNNKSYPMVNADSVYRYHVLCIARWNGKIYITNNINVFEFDGEKVTRIMTAKAPVVSMTVDRRNNLWFGYLNNGAERFKHDFKSPDLSLHPDKTVTSVIEDHEGGIWLTTLENGAVYIPNIHIETFTPQDYQKVKAVFESEGKIYIGDTKGQMRILDARTKAVLWSKDYGDPIISIFKTSKAEIWVSTTRQLDIYNRELILQQTLPVSRHHFIEQPNGNIRTVTGILLMEYDVRGKFVDKIELLKIYRVILRMDDHFLVAGRSGLETLKEDFTLLDRYPQFENIKVSGLIPLTDSTFVATTIGNGFFIVNSRTLGAQQYNSQRGFIADNIYSAVKLNNSLWLGTDKGLAKISVEDLLSNKMKAEFLTRHSGLLQNKINHITGNAHVIWIFSDDGITIVPTSGARYAHDQPKFVLNKVTVNDRNIEKTTDLNLLSDENNIQFDFRCISFNNPNILLRSRLSEKEPWIHTENLRLLYPSLAPGNYRLDVQYSLDNVNWINASQPIKFLINLPWYRKWYVQVLALIGIGILAYLYFVYQRSIFNQKNHYLKIINEHQQKLIQSEIVTLERERNRISKELHDRVGTNLTAIKLRVNQILQSHHDPHVSEVEEQFQVAIREIKEIIYGLTPPSLERYGLFTSLKNYVGKLNKSIPINISLKTFGKEVSGSDLNIILFRVLQELLNNSIKHSFAKNITIHINSFDDVLNVMYEDDGIGFTYDPLQSGLGLDNIESRIHSVNGTLKFESGKFGISYTIDIPLTINKEVV